MSDPNLPGAARYEAAHHHKPVHDRMSWPGPGQPAKLLGVALARSVLSVVGAGLLAMLVEGVLTRLGWVTLVLAPVVVLLSLARELGGSVRASLAVRVMNNGLAAAALIAGRLAGG